MTILDVPVPDELGQPGGHAESWHPQLGAGFVARGYEETPELEFPASVAVYDRMRNTESQIDAVLRAINLPILSNEHHLKTDGVADHVAEFVRTELGLGAEPRGRRRRQGIVFRDHLREALACLPLGFMPFEQVYEVGPPSSDQEHLDLPEQVAHLRKLAPRLPRTISEIRVQRDGGLAGMVQNGVGWDASGYGRGVQVIGGTGGADNSREVFIPAERLVVYCYDKEGANWSGRSLLRSAYKNWLLKDQLIRTDAIAADRHGVGVPVVYFNDQGDRQTALGIAQTFRGGSYAGAAIPDGKYRLELIGVTGQVKDVLPSIKYHDEAMGRSALAMFLNLGHDNGARALGDTFVDYFVMSLRALDEWFCEVATEHIIRDLVALNFGPDEPYPVLVCDEISSESTPTAEALKTLVDAQIIRPDAELEAEMRRRLGLPKMPTFSLTTDPDSGTSDAPADLAPGVMEPGMMEPGMMEPGVMPSDPILNKAAHLVDRIAQLRARGHRDV